MFFILSVANKPNMLSVFKLSDENNLIMLSVVMLNVVEPRAGLSICDDDILWYRFHFHSFLCFGQKQSFSKLDEIEIV